MSSPIWQLEACHAKLSIADLRAQLDADLPGQGLSRIHLGVKSLETAQLMAVEVAPGESARRLVPSDVYVRQQDLIATYAEQPGRPYAPQAYWRGLHSEENPSRANMPGVELVVSVQTSRLDAHPQLAAISRLPTIETLHLVDPVSEKFERLEAPHEGLWLDSTFGTGCLVYRLGAVGSALGAIGSAGEIPISYLEFVHPADFAHARIGVMCQAGHTNVRHQLIHRRMEKGVIVRARLQGWFVPRAEDLACAINRFRAFAESSLPLTA